MSVSLLALIILAATDVGSECRAHTRVGRVIEPRSLGKLKSLSVLPYSGERIRMRGSGEYINSGNVEVYKDHHWRYVCEDGWDPEDDVVACRSLGFTKGIISRATTNNALHNSQDPSAQLMLSRVQCNGTERDLLMCQHNYVTKCPGNRRASVACRVDNLGCPEGWIAGFGKCYNFYTKAKNINLAASVCTRENASLVVVDSVAENHFLSNIIKNSLSHVHQWYTGGMKRKHGWKWSKYELRNGTNSEQRKRNRPAAISTLHNIDINIWFPGWPLSNNSHAEPAFEQHKPCLTLSDEFQDPANKTVLVDYYYWKTGKCKGNGGFDFICQINSGEKQEDKQIENCYTDDGSGYRGNTSIAENGRICLSWSASSLVNQRTHPDKGLGDHNYCRNPDNEIRPWCWVDATNDVYGYCKLQNCADLSTSPAADEIRLVNGNNAGEGRVQVTRNGLPGSVCDDSWDDLDASVVCRMLGYKRGGVAVTGGAFGSGDGPVWLDEVGCKGTEASLWACPHGGWTNHDCEHEEDAGVRCYTHQQKEKPTVASESSIKCGVRPLFPTQKESTQSKSRRTPLEEGYNDGTDKQKRWSKVNQKIIGGNIALFGSSPWGARINIILWKNSDGSNVERHQCGGVILNEFWLISAAHCFYNLRTSAFLVYVGDYNTKVTEDDEQSFQVSDIISHENYDDMTKDYDIALIRIEPTSDGKGIKYGTNVRPVCLVDPEYDYKEGTMCTISGWGNTHRDDVIYPEIMRSASVPLIGQRLCKHLQTKLGGNFLSDRMFCAGYIMGNKDTCDGDSGGSIICKVNGVYTSVGITSWGIGCGKANYPGVYTRLAVFIPWVEATIERFSVNEHEAKLPPKP